MKDYESNGRSLVTLVMEASESDYQENEATLAFVRSLSREELQEVALYLAGWVSGYFEDMADFSAHVLRVDKKLEGM